MKNRKTSILTLIRVKICLIKITQETMNTPSPISSNNKFTFVIILIIALGLHLMILSPWIAPYLGFSLPEETKQQTKPALSLRLIKGTELIPNSATGAKTQLTSPETDIQADTFIDLNPASTKNSSLLSTTDDAALFSTTETTQENGKKLSDSAPFQIEKKQQEATKQSLSQSLESTQAESFDNSFETTSSDEELENVFSEQTRAQIILAKEAQAEYENAQVEEEVYAITEDSDGTRYVNIKGVCWRIPPQGSEEAWTIVYAGCSGQTKTFNLEINIGMDILGPDSPLAID